MRNRYVPALTRNSWAVVTPTSANTAASAGPSTRLALIITEFRLTAPARSARSTSNGTLAWNAGALRALPIPISSEATKSVHNGACVATSAARTMLKVSCTDCIATRNGPAGEPVGQHAGGDRQQQQRSELREHEQTDESRRAGPVLDVGRKGEVLHPRADVGGEQPEPDQPEVAVGEGRAGGAGTVSVGGGCGRVLTSN